MSVFEGLSNKQGGGERIQMESKSRVVVTGVGCFLPTANTAQNFFQAMKEARTLLSNITRFDTSDYRTQIGGEITCDVSDHLGFVVRNMSRNAQFSMAAAKDALVNAGLLDGSDLSEMGVCLGSGLGGIYFSEESISALHRLGPKGVSPVEVPFVDPNGIVTQVAIRWGLRGPQLTISTACSSSAHAIGQAMDWIRHGRCEMVLVGGVEATMSPLVFAGFDRVRAMSSRNDSPAIACRPFSDDRDGFVMSEGAAMLVLESADRARARGAKVLAEVLGYGASGGAHHIVAPRPDGHDLKITMQKALLDAELTADEIDGISPHGTGTLLNDEVEERALHEIFGERLYAIPLSPIKQLTGHLLGAAGALEVVHTVQSIASGYLTPVQYYNAARPLCVSVDQGREFQQRKVLKNSFGFGNNNVSLVLGEYLS